MPPGLGIDVDHMAMLDEAIDEGRNASGAGKHRAPLSKRQVGRDDNRSGFVPPTDDVVEQVCRSVVARQVADLVEDEKAGPHVTP